VDGAYLKGIHLTIDSWQEDRDQEGYRWWTWNWQNEKWYNLDLEPPEVEGEKASPEAPELVRGVPRLKEDASNL
jgi:hypothetical protein